jgi:hypothetical protein
LGGKIVTAAARARRGRQRRKSGIIVVPVAIEEFSTVEALIDARRVSEEGSRKREVVGAALAQIIEEWATENKL